jgi:GNAT superfamily N-acetyltransferase
MSTSSLSAPSIPTSANPPRHRAPRRRRDRAQGQAAGRGQHLRAGQLALRRRHPAAPQLRRDLRERPRLRHRRVRAGVFLGCGALHLYGPHLAEVRSIVVKPEAKGQGAGGQLLRACSKRPKSRASSPSASSPASPTSSSTSASASPTAPPCPTRSTRTARPARASTPATRSPWCAAQQSQRPRRQSRRARGLQNSGPRGHEPVQLCLFQRSAPALRPRFHNVRRYRSALASRTDRGSQKRCRRSAHHAS